MNRIQALPTCKSIVTPVIRKPGRMLEANPTCYQQRPSRCITCAYSGQISEDPDC